VRDEAEIRGHRRTYVGALPGRIIQSIRKAGSNNPLFMLDEVDKLGTDFRGDPASALLEVLDPEQNNSFSDHYLEVPFDLSKVLFITTANLLDPIPPPLLDRMETIELPGYTEQEKIQIAKRYLIPRQIEGNGLTAARLHIKLDALKQIIRGYTREAGVRNLEREIGGICRKVARKVAEGHDGSTTVRPADLHDLLGPQKVFPEEYFASRNPGVATGLAWTSAGGEVLSVESTIMRGGKGLLLTGQLGNVMKESAQAALSYLRSRADDWGIGPAIFADNEIHIHVPAGAIPKDGPSAGVTMATSLLSLLTGQPVRPRLAMTGEVTLQGRVLRIGGVKEKVLAAHQAGVRTVVLPKHNMGDLEDVPKQIRDTMTFVPVETLDELFAAAFAKPIKRPVAAAHR
jgi:ATP-dependent Lon protease